MKGEKNSFFPSGAEHINWDEIIKRFDDSDFEVVEKVIFTGDGQYRIKVQCKKSFLYGLNERHPSVDLSTTNVRIQFAKNKKISCMYCSMPFAVITPNDSQRLLNYLKSELALKGCYLLEKEWKTINDSYSIYNPDDPKHNLIWAKHFLVDKRWKPDHGLRISNNSGKRKRYFTFVDLKMECEKKGFTLLLAEDEFENMITYEYRSALSLKLGLKFNLSEKQLPIFAQYGGFDFERPLYWYFGDNLPNDNLKCEKICRFVFEKMLFPGFSFDKIKHPQMQSPFSNRFLELDGYCDTLKIAFEHDGDYHLTDPYIRQKDLAKNKYCEQLGIVLIRIPQLFQRVKIDDLIPFIQDQLAKNGKPINVISPLLELNDLVYKYILKEDEFMLEKKLNEFNELMQELTEYRIIRTKSFVSGFRTDFMVTVLENQSQRQKSFRYSNKLMFLEQLNRHFKLKVYQRVSGVPLRVIKKSTGEIFSSMSAAAKSIGKKQSYLSARLRLDKHTGKTRCENDTDFEMYIEIS
jgi:very-short-patch-repair endonuclease